MVGSRSLRNRHGPLSIGFTRTESKARPEMDMHGPATGRHHLGIPPASAGMDATGPYLGGARLVLCVLSVGLFFSGRVMRRLPVNSQTEPGAVGITGKNKE